MRAIVAIFAVAVIASPAVAEQPDIMTGGLVNGTAWHQLGAVERVMFVRGVLDASTAASYAAGKPSEVIQNHWACKCGLDEITSGIEAIYARDATYRIIPTYFLVPKYLQKRVGKITEVQLARDLEQLISVAKELQANDKSPH